MKKMFKKKNKKAPKTEEQSDDYLQYTEAPQKVSRGYSDLLSEDDELPLTLDTNRHRALSAVYDPYQFTEQKNSEAPPMQTTVQGGKGGHSGYGKGGHSGYGNEDTLSVESYDLSNDNPYSNSSPAPQLKTKVRKSGKKGLEKKTWDNPERPSRLIHQADLAMGKRMLKNPAGSLKPITLDRAALFDSFETFDYFPLLYCETFLKSQIAVGDITCLNFSGVDQLTDAFFYILYAKQIQLKNLSILLCQGCVHLSDMAVGWIVQLFPNLNIVNFNGCSKLTEKSLHNVLTISKLVAEIYMVGTNVCVGRIDPDEVPSVKQTGCPIVTNSGPGAENIVPLEVFKVVSLTDHKLTCSVGERLTAKSGAEKGVSFWPNWRLENLQYKFRLFEVGADESVSDLLLSNGCIVLLPFPESGFDQDTVVQSLYTRMMRVASKFPDSVCVIVGTEGKDTERDTVKLDTKEVKKALTEKITALKTSLDEEIKKIFKYKWIIDTFRFNSQVYLVQWVKEFQTISRLQFFHASLTPTEASAVKKSSFPSPFSKATKGSESPCTITEAIQQAVNQILSWQPYYRDVSPDLFSIASSLPLPLRPGEVAYKHVPKEIRSRLHSTNALPHIIKGWEILNLRGVLMYHGNKDGGFVAQDVDYFIKGVNSLQDLPPSSTTLPCLEPGSSCWKMADIINHLQGEEVKDMVTVLVEQGCILALRGEDSLEGASDDDNTVYVAVDQLPGDPPQHLEELWPAVIPENDLQTERFYTFIPELPASLLSTFFSQLSRVYQFSLLWRRGVLIQHGPVDILVQQVWDETGRPVIAVCCRTFKPQSWSSNAHFSERETRKCLYSSLITVTRILDYVIRKYQVWAKITIPCPTCVPTKELSRMLQSDLCHYFHIVTFTNGLHCPIEGTVKKTFRSVDVLGPVTETDSVVPRHKHWYLDQTKSSFQQRDRCYQCCRINRDQQGKSNIQCPTCGTCNNCVEFLAEVEKTLMPGFGNARGAKGSLASTNLINSLLPIHHSMRPALFNEVKATLLRGNQLTFILNMLKSNRTLKFDLNKGCLSVTGPGDEEYTTDPDWRYKEGDHLNVKVQDGKNSRELEIICYLNGSEIWKRVIERQSIMPQFGSKDSFLSFFLHTPGIKAYWQTSSSLDQLVEKMCLEYEQTEGNIVSARVTGNNGKTITLITDHLSPVNLENAKTVELTSTKLHPAGYAQSLGVALNGQTLEDSPNTYDYKVENGATLAPLWLFNEVQRGQVIQVPTGEVTPDVMPCLVHSSPASIQSEINQLIPKVETAVYKNGGIDFTGSAYALLPNNEMLNLEKPSRHAVGDIPSLQCQALCYIRAECEDMLNLHPAKQEISGRNPYWQVHFTDSEGPILQTVFNMEEVIKDYIPFFWIWHALLGSLEELVLPDSTNLLFPNSGVMNIKQLSSSVLRYIRWQCYRLYLSILDNSSSAEGLLEDPDMLAKLAGVMQHHTKERLEVCGLQESVTLLSQDTIHLCPAHVASQQLHASLTEFPSADFAGYTRFITSLKVEGNEIDFLPDNFFTEFTALLDLQLSTNHLFDLPAGIGNCRNLRNLKLKDNLFQTLPSDLSDCEKLCLLEISGNPMDEIPAVVMEIKSLERLYINNMQLPHLPENIGKLANLDVLNASGNCISRLPASFKELKKLTQLYLNGIPWMPVKQNTLLSKYQFETFLGKYAHLLDWLEDHDHDKAVLYNLFDEDQNGTLDAHEVSKLNAVLFVLFPRIGHKGKQLPEDESYSGFPEEILGLERLEYLSLQYQGLVTLPETISTLKKLQNINLSHNPYLTTVAASAGSLPLKTLALDDCPSLKTPPKEIRARGFGSTYAYLRRLLTGSMECHRTKLMFVGLGGAGKTSLSRALLSGNMKTDVNASEAITDGIDISTWTVKSGEDHISYSVWDFAGQTVYYNTHQFFLSDRAVYLLLWNIRLGHEHAGLDFWLSSISVHAPKAPIFVIGTHLDKVSKTEIPMAEMRLKFPQITGFHFISSHTGQGISELQQNLFEVTLHQPYMGEKIPGVWLSFERKIMAKQSEKSVMKFKDIEQLASEAGIFDQSEISQAIQFLHDLGALQHFNNEFLRSYVVINPQWIVDVMTCVVSVKDSPIQEGRFQHSDIGIVWRDYPAELHQWLLRLTEEFDLTFPMTDQQLNLVPCLLPERQPEITWPELDRNSSERETKMVYKFSYLPAGLFNRGQVRLCQFSDSSLIWKRGSLLRKNGHRALLQQTKESEMMIKVQGPRPENILFLIHEVFEGLIVESFHGITYDFLVPCPDCLKSASREPHMFSASTVRRASELKAPFLQCMKYFHTISIIDLLASMPPDNNTDYDIHLVSAVRGLKGLKKDLSADIFISYSPQNLGSNKIYSDLEEAGYKCWYPKDGRQKNVDLMAKALMDCQVFVALISNEYVHDKNCCDMFKYARLIHKKPVILVVVGTGFEWRKSKLGMLLADNLFVNMQKSDQYKMKFEELLGQIQERVHLENKDRDHPPCFISYSWQNSAVAVSKGTRLTEGALGYGDPRGIKDYLEENGMKCWIDVERVGLTGLFEDIAEGLLNAKMMVACVSDEYANSPNCQFEFRFAANTLKLPIALAVMGTGNAWRAKEVGVLSLDYPMVSFQEKSSTAHEKLLSFVKKTLENEDEENVERKKKKKNDANEAHKNMSFTELYELAQRKFLRQVAHYAEKQEALYPRLFVADFVADNLDDENMNLEDENKGETEKLSRRRPQSSKMQSRASLDSAEDDAIGDFHRKKYCFYILCEHEEGWHSCSEPLLASEMFGQSKLERYSPYLSRITTILRYNRQVMLNCMAGHDGDTYLHWLEQNPQAAESDFQTTYHEFREDIINADSARFMGNLSRCHLPNGKTIWLCEEHQKASRLTVLSNEFATMTTGVTETTTENLMLDHLGELDDKDIVEKFGSSGPRKRKSVKSRKTAAGSKKYRPATKSILWPGTLPFKAELLETAKRSDTTPKTRDATPKTRDATPKTRDATPETRDPTPETRDPTPETRDPTHKTRDATPETRDPTPETRDPTPETRDTTPDTRDTTPETRDTTPDTRDTTPETRDTTPETVPATKSVLWPETLPFKAELLETVKHRDTTSGTRDTTHETRKTTPETMDTSGAMGATPEARDATPATRDVSSLDSSTNRTSLSRQGAVKRGVSQTPINESSRRANKSSSTCNIA